jgi:hypothetical protein
MLVGSILLMGAAVYRVELLSPSDGFHFGDVRSIGENNMPEFVFQPVELF